MTNPSFKIIECPRDAMQGLSFFVPTEVKIAYLNLLLKVGFDTLDFGSFVSPKAIPQMADSAEVLTGLDMSSSSTKLLAIVANMRGVEAACAHNSIHYLGFPLSVSETFQRRNTSASIDQGFELVKQCLELCPSTKKELVVYLSMAFGNPYGDPHSPDLVVRFVDQLVQMGCRTISLADTVGLANDLEIKELGKQVVSRFPEIEIGMHLHSRPDTALSKAKAALDSGCTRIDTALGGLGGCPMAEDVLVGNLPTEVLVSYALEKGLRLGLDAEKLRLAKDYLQTHVLAQ